MTNTEQIRDVVARYTEAIHTQDKEAFCSLWSASPACTLISITNPFYGVENICQHFLIDGIKAAYSEIKLVAESIDVREVNENMATVVFRYHTECIRREDGEPFGIKGLETQVMVKENGEWKLLHIHYSM